MRSEDADHLERLKRMGTTLGESILILDETRCFYPLDLMLSAHSGSGIFTTRQQAQEKLSNKALFMDFVRVDDPDVPRFLDEKENKTILLSTKNRRHMTLIHVYSKALENAALDRED